MKCVILVLLLVIFSIFTVYADSCEKDGKCDFKCVDGDLDCSCDLMDGDACDEDENCKGNLLKNFENDVCCSIECTEGSILNSSGKLQYFVSEPEALAEKNFKGQETEIKKEFSEIKEDFSIVGMLILIIITMISVIYFVHKRNANINDYTIPGKKTIKMDEFFNDILKKLNDSEEKVVMALVENNGLSLDELKNDTKLSIEKLKNILAKLKKRQIVNSKGNNFYLNEGFK